MKMIFLGTSSGIPTKERNVSSIALQLPQRKEVWLFDCGEATQHQILKNPEIKISHIRKIFITHMHGDHIYGLPGLLSTLNLQDFNKEIDIYGPSDLQEFIEHALRMSQCHLRYSINFHSTKDGLILEDNQFRVSCAPLIHRIPAHGFRVEEKSRHGVFNIEKARNDDIPEGPLYKQLKNKETITLPNGRVIDGKDYVGPDIPGRIMCYCSDTTYSKNAIKLAKDADVLVHEATFLDEEKELAIKYQHATIKMATDIANKANVKTLVLTHFSARYEKKAQKLFLEQAKKYFDNTLIAYDGFSYQL